MNSMIRVDGKDGSVTHYSSRFYILKFHSIYLKGRLKDKFVREI